MLKPIAPFIEYAINYDYISKVLCINQDKPELACNGKCQLMQKLEQQQEDDFNSLRISMEEYPIGFVKILEIYKTNTIDFYSLKNYFHSNNYKYLFCNSLFQPPIV